MNSKKAIHLFLYFFSVIIYSQEQLPDTTFVKKIHFDVTKKNLTNDELRKKRNSYEYNYFLQDEESNIQLIYNPELENTIKKYYTYKWLPKIFGLLSYYEPMFEESLTYYKLPTDLKYIAVIESNLNPQAGSNMGASGLWQFMPQTGKNYGLVKNQYINLFYDPYFSTDAACRYFVYLYKLFEDWNLAISAYNCGQGCVLKAIKKAKSKDYFRVRNYLPKETRDYVMRFHSVKFLHKKSEIYYDYEFRLPISFDKVREHKIDSKTSFTKFCKEMKVNLQMTYFLNPHIITEIIPANTFIYYL